MDVRDAINAGAIPGPRLLTSIHQITERIPWNQSSGESRARANQGAGGGGRSALATMGSVTDSGDRLAGFRERRFIGSNRPSMALNEHHSLAFSE